MATALTPASHPGERTGAHDIMDGSAVHDTPYHTVIHGTVWPGMILDNAYVVTECYEEDGSDTFRWFCEPVATPVPRRQSGEPGTPAPEACEPPLARTFRLLSDIGREGTHSFSVHPSHYHGSQGPLRNGLGGLDAAIIAQGTQARRSILAAEAERIVAVAEAESAAQNRRLEEMTGIPHPH